MSITHLREIPTESPLPGAQTIQGSVIVTTER